MYELCLIEREHIVKTRIGRAPEQVELLLKLLKVFSCELRK